MWGRWIHLTTAYDEYNAQDALFKLKDSNERQIKGLPQSTSDKSAGKYLLSLLSNITLYLKKNWKQSFPQSHVLCIMYYVICIIYCLFCIIYYVFNKVDIMRIVIGWGN